MEKFEYISEGKIDLPRVSWKGSAGGKQRKLSIHSGVCIYMSKVLDECETATKGSTSSAGIYLEFFINLIFCCGI